MKDCDLGIESGGFEDEVRGSGADLSGESELRMEDKARRLIGMAGRWDRGREADGEWRLGLKGCSGRWDRFLDGGVGTGKRGMKDGS